MITKANEIRQRGRIATLARMAARSPVTKFLMRLLKISIDDIERSLWWLVVTGVVGGVLTGLAPYLFNAPQLIGHTMAQWCIERGSCDFTTNYTSVALGLFISISIFVYFATLMLVDRSPRRSIYYDVRDAVFDADEKGITAEQISDFNDLDIADVHEMLRYLHNDGEIDAVGPYRGKAVQWRKTQANEPALH